MTKQGFTEDCPLAAFVGRIRAGRGCSHRAAVSTSDGLCRTVTVGRKVSSSKRDVLGTEHVSPECGRFEACEVDSDMGVDRE